MNTATAPRARRLVRTIGGHRRWILATAALATIASSAGLGLGGFSAHLISRSAVIDSTASVALLIVAVRFFAVVRVVIRYCERSVGHLATFALLTRLRVWLFARVIPVAPGGLLDHRTGALLSTFLDDVDTMQEFYLRVMVPPIVAAATLLIAILIEGSSSIAAALALALCAAVAGLVVPLVTRRRTRGPIEHISALRGASAAGVHELLAARRELIAFGADDRYVDSIAALDHSRRDAHRRSAAARGTADAALGALATAASVLVLIIAVPLVRNGSLDGQMLAVLPLVALVVFEVIAPLTNAIGSLDRSEAAADRLLAITEAPTPITEPSAAEPMPAGGTTPRITVTDLGFAHGDIPVLEHLSLDAPAGSLVVITGASGSGKSTLLDLFLRFDSYRGSIRLDDIELEAFGSTDSRRMFAPVRQHDHVFDTTVRDNLLLADPDADDTAMGAALDLAGLHEFIARAPDGLATRTGHDGDRLSGGERQRLLIARAMLADRPILLLDEAFEHLEPALRAEVHRSVLTHSRGRTVVMVNHDPDDSDTVELTVTITASPA